MRGIKIVKLIIGVILAQGIALGIVLGLVWLIPIRGTELAMIVCPIGCLAMLGFTYLAGNWALRSRGNER